MKLPTTFKQKKIVPKLCQNNNILLFLFRIFIEFDKSYQQDIIIILFSKKKKQDIVIRNYSVLFGEITKLFVCFVQKDE